MNSTDTGHSDPIALFLAVRARAETIEPWNATACALATADASGKPSCRFMLVKEVDAEGFWFYTHETSRKGAEIAANPRAAIAFHWPTQHVQFRIEGRLRRASAERSDSYFASRPRISQLGAWASDQSRPIASREALMERLAQREREFDGAPVARPPHWTGYCLVPERIEHWVEGEYRLHDRILYTRKGDEWVHERLGP